MTSKTKPRRVFSPCKRMGNHLPNRSKEGDVCVRAGDEWWGVQAILCITAVTMLMPPPRGHSLGQPPRTPLRQLPVEVTRGFTRGSGHYERTRPGYPPAALRFVHQKFHLGPGRHVVDVGAGTGKWTRELVTTGAEVTAVEPLPAMRRILRQQVPGARVVAARGEATGLPTRSTDLITLAQSFHWLDAERALAEFRRILRPGGGLAVLYNHRDEPGARGSEVRALLAEYQPDSYRAYGEGAWKRTLERSPFYSDLQIFRYRHSQLLTREEMLERYQSVSFISALSPSRRDQFLERLATILDDFSGRSRTHRFRIPYRGAIYWCRLRPES